MNRSVSMLFIGASVVFFGCMFLPQAYPLFSTGEIYASGTDDQDGGVFRIDPVMGNRSIVSGFGIGSGPVIDQIFGLTGDSVGNLYASVLLAGDPGPFTTILKIDPTSGDRTILSSSLIGVGITDFIVYAGLHWSNGTLLAGDIANDAIFSVDTTNGDRQIISKSSLAQGPMVGSGLIISQISGMQVDSSGSIIVSDIVNMSIVSIDPSTGNRTIISKYGEQGTGPELDSPFGLVINPIDHSLIVTDFYPERVVRVDPLAGDRSVIYARGMSGGVGPFFEPRGLELEPGESLLLFEVEDHQVIRYDLTSGHQTILSNTFPGNIGSGPIFDLYDFFVVPATVPEPSTLLLVGAFLSNIAYQRPNARKVVR